MALTPASAVLSRVPIAPAVLPRVSPTPAGRRKNLGAIPVLLLRPECVISNTNPSMFQENLKTCAFGNASNHQKYVYPAPIPDFAEAETRKFKAELLEKLQKDEETFGDDLDDVIEACAEIFSKFLRSDYGGPGTLLVEPFTDIFVVLKEKQLPGASLAARAALLWAQNHVDLDWEVWNSEGPQ